MNESSRKGLILNKGQIVEERGDIVYEIQLDKSVINYNALIILPSTKSSNIERLYGMCKVS